MEFRRLKLAGFKSFVEAVELRIEPGLTGVVGPNGCGKSNLLEALRWVMGEGSPKSLRSDGMDAVIFAGTATRPARGFATVSLVVAGAGGEEIEVARRIERGTGSDYRVNGREARAQDIRLLFADNATGAHSPAIVGQGRIGAIIAAKPSERRALLEEAAGIAGLHVRRREAEIRLRAAEANVARLDDVVRGLETQAAALKRQARIAERYRLLTAQLKVADARLVHARWLAACAGAAAARLGAGDAEAQAVALTRTAAALAGQIATAQAGLPGLRHAEAEAAAAMQALHQARSLLDAEAAMAARRLADLHRDRAAIARDAAREADLAGDAAGADARLAEEADGIAARLTMAATRLPALQAASRDAETASGASEAALAEALGTHAAAAAAARAARDALAGAMARLAQTEQETAGLAAARARLQPAPDAAPLMAAHAEAEAGLSTADRALADAEAARPAAEAARDAAAMAAAAARATLAALVAEAEALDRRLTSDTAKEPRIADAIEVEAGFEAALAAALGDDLDAPGAGSDARRRWAGTPAFPDDPPLPAGARPLREVAKAPPELARRLAQIGIVADAAAATAVAQRLHPGQRLVSPGGALWRWDGFIDAGGRGDAAAARLRARRRAAEVAAEIAGARSAGDAAARALGAADATHGAALAAERAARGARVDAMRAVEAARARLTAAETAAARAAGEAESLANAEQRLAGDLARRRDEVAAAQAALIDPGHVAALAAGLTRAGSRAEAARAALAGARAAADRAARDVETDARRCDAVAVERARWADRVAASAAQQAELAARDAAAVAAVAALTDRGGAIETERAGLASRIEAVAATRATAADALAAAETALAARAAEARAADEAVAAAREVRAAARAEAEHQDAARIEIERGCGERFQCSPPLLPARFDFAPGEADAGVLAEASDELSTERERLGAVNLRADIELAELAEQARAITAERGELDTAIARLRGSIGSLNREGRARLSEAFNAVDAHFRALFGTLFAGGEARLELIESDDPLEAGLEIMAQPPGKKLQSLALLSGGEQALTATALIFALFLANPAPICVLDEVDAPLDDANVERFCDLLDRMAIDTATRFLIVTHNAVTMSRMHRLYGVTMAEPGVSKLVSVDLQGAEALLAAE